MTPVRLSGQLICSGPEELAAVETHLDRHRELSRAEPGCLAFDVQQTADPLVWQVDEAFTDDAAFAAHQERVAGSAWGLATADIERRYEVNADGQDLT
ncbi:antibiotic biosynthesis monooxygenase [Brachybacterium endophyticum]|uniref:Antibiotic biosynthesis monooxygenase n=1 Tax=Brachybacterium endophyticum TaxID=2182385 RepID=A0A2U2RGR9_9MICO|nr:antibiotic biosynthesis monooxygenase [Brachybacterium endophyticum]PWH05057.1 antibiotic biosynthesis monooxygenase [Brachybacterium endophyticum]